MRVFITGTGTNIGKTIISGWLLSHLKHYYYWKPIQSGTSENSDIDFIRSITNRIFQPIYSFPEPLSPHLAAKINHTQIDLSKIQNQTTNEENLIIEGAGGVLVLDETKTFDLSNINDSFLKKEISQGLKEIF